MLFPYVSLNLVLIIYAAAALIPAIILMVYIYRKDAVEKEPSYLLIKMLKAGVLAVIASIALETVGVSLLSAGVSENSPYYTIILAFLVVACVEEGTKFFFMKRASWKDPNFSHLFDGVVYAAFTSLSFAAIENLRYVFSYGLSVALPRAIFSVPGHFGFAVFMGVYYGRAKRCELWGDTAGMKRNLRAAFFWPVFFHGFYDSCAMINTSLSSVLFYIFVFVMYIVVIRLVRKEAKNDRTLYE